MANPETKSYWNAELDCLANRSETSSPEQTSLPAERVRALLENAVRSHFIADVPIGVFLSSGLDSTAIAALASGHQAGFHTLTVAFPDLEFSEAEQARRTADRLAHRITANSPSPGRRCSVRLDEAIAAFDQPSMDGINTYFVSWAARQAGLKVALSGLGSDELFGGYTSFRDASTVAKVAALAGLCPRPIRAWAATAFDGSPSFRRFSRRFPKSPGCVARSFVAPRRLFLYADAVHSPEGRCCSGRKIQLLAGLRLVEVAVRGRGASRRSMDSFTKISWLESRSYLVNTLLRDTDAMSMHHSLEVRVPFLDLPLGRIYAFASASPASGGVAARRVF